MTVRKLWTIKWTLILSTFLKKMERYDYYGLSQYAAVVNLRYLIGFFSESCFTKFLSIL